MTDELAGESDVASTIESLSVPRELRERDGFSVREETRTLDSALFDHWTEKAGVVGVGVPTDDGEVLLMNGPHGWTLPYAETLPDDDWASVARRGVENLTGVGVEIDSVARASRVENRLVGSDETRRTYEVVFRAQPVADDALADEMAAGVSDESIPEVGWFDDVPDGAGRHEDAEDEVADVRLFVD